MNGRSSSGRPHEAQWIKSTRSANNGRCVEMCSSPATVAVRDSRNPDRRPRLPRPTFDAVLTAVIGR
ncbi:hypothetical protein FHR81_004265 [Actinoalloteichus hoggarensis]|uniref:Uncharacterized protein n=1 Tax=Actinoalloteichus hoggarensis TaxID=1470176 RepID=A0A221WA26_9PSEU|nr:hypothetical protein AHOG_23865 [Actinoalloteichus hoggarensis]MBB5923198.1 hypothetical protein [Actinoalloteichus hoggarensis]